MCKIYATRKSLTTVYIELEDEKTEYWGVKKLPIDKFEYAKKFRNMDFLSFVAYQTSVEEDEDDAMRARSFVDKDITYSRRDYALS